MSCEAIVKVTSLKYENFKILHFAQKFPRLLKTFMTFKLHAFQ